MTTLNSDSNADASNKQITNEDVNKMMEEGFCFTDMSTEEKRRIFIGRIEDREQRRKNAHELRKRAREKVDCKLENPVVFQERFQECAQQLKTDLDGIEPGKSPQAYEDFFEKFTDGLEELQQYLSESALFLSAFDSESAKRQIQSLQKDFVTKRDELLPKKKFAFGKREKAKSKPANTNKENIPKTNQTMKSKLAEFSSANQYTINDLSSECITLTSEIVESRDLLLRDLTDCEIRIIGKPGALHLGQLTNCKIYCGPVSGSVLALDCNHCVFQLACQQLRMHTSHDTVIALFVMSKAIIEDCHDLFFTNYSLTYPNLKEDLESTFKSNSGDYCSLTNIINWKAKVDDFYHLSHEVDSPNWSELPADKAPDYRVTLN